MTLRSITASACAIVTFVCASIMPGNAYASQPEKETFTAHQLFSGLFFGTGRVAAALPEVWNDNTRQYVHFDRLRKTPGFVANISRVERALDRVDHGFTAQFAADITSGDPGRVQRVINRTKLDLAKVRSLDRTAPIQMAAYPNSINQVQSVNVLETAFQAILAIAIVVAAIFVLVVSVPLDQHGGINGYPEDRSIAAVTSRLQGRLAAN